MMPSFAHKEPPTTRFPSYRPILKSNILVRGEKRPKCGHPLPIYRNRTSKGATSRTGYVLRIRASAYQYSIPSLRRVHALLDGQKRQGGGAGIAVASRFGDEVGRRRQTLAEKGK